MSRSVKTVLCLLFQIICVSYAEQNLLSTEFIWDFFKASFNERQNVALSPFTIHLGMSMMTPIVTDRYTLNQMVEKLHLPSRNLGKLPDLYRRKLTSAVPNDPAFRFGTKLYAFGEEHINPAFVASMYNFNATLERRPWMNATRVVQDANAWAHRTTSGAVKEILSTKDLYPDTRLILLSAVAFGAEWEHAFSINRTKKEMFNAYSIGKLYMLELMELKQALVPMTVNEDLRMTAVELPFRKGSDLSLLVVMPTDRDGNMTTLMSRLNEESFGKLYDSLIPMRVTVRMPRFEMGTTLNVKDVFEKLQLGAPFKWSVFQVFEKEKLALDKVKHSVKVEVNEQGVRAAAVSAFTMGLRSAPWTFTVDRPFLYVVLKQSTRFPLFVGNYAFPAKSTPVFKP